jgi:ATP-binding cassette, subfamily B, bacterial
VNLRHTKKARGRRRYRPLLKYPLQHWPALGLILVLTSSASLIAALTPWPLKILVDYALGDNELPVLLASVMRYVYERPDPVALILLAAAAGLGLYLINSIVDTGLTWSWATAGQQMVNRLTADLYHRFQELSPLYHTRQGTGDALNRLTGDTYCVYALTSNILILPWQKTFTLITVGIIAWNLHPELTLLSMAVAPVMAGSTLFFAPRIRQRAKLNREEQSRLMNFVHQTITALPLVQSFGTEQRNQHQFRNIATRAVNLSQRMALLESAHQMAHGFVSAAGIAVILYAGSRQVLTGALSVGSLIVFLAYLNTIQDAIRGLLGIYGNLKVAEAGMDRVLEVLDAPETVSEVRDGAALPSLSGISGRHIRIEQMTFGYETGRPVLTNVSLEVCPGETVAIVGPTGSGKSTLVSLIIRLFDPWQGRITFDGIDIRCLRLSDLRSQVAIVLQESFLLPVTVAENIAYGRPEASRSQIVKAAVEANADEFIQKLPQGYDTVIGERGHTLSGGQQQRLAIARALVKNAPILILDEPTSALDAQTEASLQLAMETLMAGRTTFIIAHRLATVRRANRIFVIENGQVKETGSHRELLQMNGLYRKLHNLQSLNAAVPFEREN